jgi:DNA modification methylase
MATASASARIADQHFDPSVPLDKLTPHPKNPRKGNVPLIAESIQANGFYGAVIAQRTTGHIIAGEHRWRAARQKKLPAVPVFWLDVDDDRALRILLADNRTNDVAGYDDEILAEILKGMEDLSGTGWDDDALAKLLGDEAIDGDDAGAKIDHAAELQVKWGTELGQLWEIPSAKSSGTHRLLCGNSTSVDDVTRLMNGQRACLFATDPPYLVAYDGTNHPHKWTKSHGTKHPGDKDWSDKYTDVDSPELGEALYDAFVKVAVDHAITDTAAWYCWHASRKQALLESVWEKHGAFVHQQIIWAKDRPILTRSWYMWQHEPCFFGWKKGKKPKRAADNYPPSVWSFATQAAGETTDHPTQKPVELFAIPIRQHTKKGDICYEPFSGSGTQLVAAEQLGRLCYAMELSPPFVAVALERMAALGLKPTLAK